jgi:hypothetical protein
VVVRGGRLRLSVDVSTVERRSKACVSRRRRVSALWLHQDGNFDQWAPSLGSSISDIVLSGIMFNTSILVAFRPPRARSHQT